MNKFVEAALSYAASGYLVFPCKPRSKEPATKHGFKDATRDQETIRRWWSENPNYNIAIATGKESGLWVLDVDGEEGRESYLKYQSDIPYDTPNVKTPNGGFHLYFAYDEQAEKLRNSVKSLPGLDVRTEGGYVFAAGSVLEDGWYEYLNSWREPTQAPESLLRAIRAASERRGLMAPVEATIPEGQRNDTLFRRARSLFAQGYDETEVFSLLYALNQNRCKPPVDDNELTDIARSAAKYSRGELYISSDDEVGVLMSNVEAEEIEWLWEGRIPLGKLTILNGDPSRGKSVITMDLTARVTTGLTFPNGGVDHLDYLGNVGNLGNVSGVVILSAEDGLADTIRPRLDAAGADVSKVLALSTVRDDKGNDRILSIPEDMEVIERAIRRVNAKLVIVDPVMAFLSSDIKSNNGQQVGQALTPLKEMAERTGVAVLLVRHMSKQEGRKSLYRGGGSIGIIGAARSALVVEEHPENENLRVLAVNKANLAEKADSLTYTITTADNGAALVQWGATTELDADDILNPHTSKLNEAKTWLRGALSDGPVLSEDIKAKAKKEGIKERTLIRAKDELGVEAEKDGPDGSWRWHLEDCQDSQECQDNQDRRQEMLGLAS